MRRSTVAVCVGLLVSLSACGSSDRQADRAQERAYEAQERVAEERLGTRLDRREVVRPGQRKERQQLFDLRDRSGVEKDHTLRKATDQIG